MLWTDLTFGVEIESYVGTRVDVAAVLRRAGIAVSQVLRTHEVTTGWKVVHDGSLNSAPSGTQGREVVSPVLRGVAGLAEVARVAAAIKAAGALVNKSCGLHVHVGVGSFSVPQIKNLAKQFVRNEHCFDEVCPMSRRDNAPVVLGGYGRYAMSNLAMARADYRPGMARGERQDEINAACARIDAVRTVESVARIMNGGYDTANHYNHYRYFRLNFQRFAAQGTVEFRQQAGSVEAAKICGWIKTVTQFAAAALTLRTVASVEAPTFDAFLRKVDRDTAKFLADRRARLSPQAPAAPAAAPATPTSPF